MKIAFESVPSEFVSETSFYDYKVPVTESLASISKNGSVVVTKDGEYFGVVDSRTVGRKGVKIGKGSTISKFAVKVPVIDSSTSIEKAVYLFYHSGSKALPFYEGKKITGIVKRETILKAVLSLHLLSDYKVREIMSTPIVAVSPQTQVTQALSIMNKGNINRLVVMNGDRAEGMVTYRSILQETGGLENRSADRKDRVGRSQEVGQIIENEPISIDQDKGVDDAIRELVEKDISCLLVRKVGKPIGMLTIRDLFEVVTKGSAAGSDENIVISGLDDWTTEFKDDIMEELKKLEEKINRFNKLDVESISANVKRHRAKNYEVKLRVWLKRRGVVSAASSGFTLNKTLDDTISKVYNSIVEKKEIVYSEQRGSRGEYDDTE